MSVLLALAMQVATQPPVTRPRTRRPKPAAAAPVTQATLDGWSKECRTPRKWLELKDNEIIMRGSPDSDETKLRCVLEKMSAATSPRTNSLIGNAPVSEDQ